MSGSPGGSENSCRGKDPMQYSDDEDEGKDGYKVGGYHAVKVRKVYRHALIVAAGAVVGESRSRARLTNKIQLA